MEKKYSKKKNKNSFSWLDFKEEVIPLINIQDLHLSPQKIHFISNENDKVLDFAFKEFQSQKMVGFDLEEYWGQQLCLIQLSTYQNVFLFDPLTLHSSGKFLKKMIQLFSDKNIVKIGFSIGQDMKQLLEYLDDYKAKFRNILDLQQQFKEKYKLKNQPGLGKVCQIYFKKGLNKLETCSDWSKRPLRKEQVHYAAIDARVLLDLFTFMNNQKDDKKIIKQFKKLKLH